MGLHKGQTNKGSFKKGNISFEGESHPNWIGDAVGYHGLHSYIRRHLPKPLTCEHCHKVKKLELSNKSRQYKRELSDWQWICRSCHRKYDKRKICKRGHELTEENILINKKTGIKKCKKCAYMRSKNYRLRRIK